MICTSCQSRVIYCELRTGKCINDGMDGMMEAATRNRLVQYQA
jgi:hypothetical protein